MNEMIPAIEPERKVIPLAKASFILGCCSPAIPLFLGSIGAIVCGHMAMKEFRRDPTLPGRKMAIWGLTLGYLSIPISFVVCLAILIHLGH